MKGFLEQIKTLKESEFPYPHSKVALSKIETQAERHLATIQRLKPTNSLQTTQQICSQALTFIHRNLPLLGFITRSTDVRNAFEVYWPLLRLCRNILEPGVPSGAQSTKLVLSSEWMYSPLMFAIPDLQGFVLIGLPAHESTNPLLIPLAGHELGHSLWVKISGDPKFKIQLKDNIDKTILQVLERRWNDYVKVFNPTFKSFEKFELNDLTTLSTWQKASEWLGIQLEETFCDMVGIRLFGNAYLRAFSYLLSPSFEIPRNPIYPDLRKRVENIILGAKFFGLPELPEYESLFKDFLPLGMSNGDNFQLSVADDSLDGLREMLANLVNENIPQTSALSPNDVEIQRIIKTLDKGIPAVRAQSLTDIINAGWLVYEALSNDQDEEVLKELILKNIEVFEIEQIRKGSNLASSLADLGGVLI